MQKSIIFSLLIVCIGAIVAAGCTSTGSTNATTQATTAPNITGTWTGTMQGYDEGTGFTDYNGETISIVVAEQHDRIFSGKLIFESNGTEQSEDIAGTIGRDGRTLTLVEKSGYSSGIIVSDNEIELTYMDDGPQFTTAVDSLMKV
jgi:ABC-type transport system substrate-binding protein